MLLGDVQPGAYDIVDVAMFICQGSIRPGDIAFFTAFGQPVIFMCIGKLVFMQVCDDLFYFIDFLFQQKKIPEIFSGDFLDALTGYLLACGLEANDVSLVVQYHHQGAKGFYQC